MVLEGARRPQRLVNRQEQLAQIQAALTPGDQACRVVLIRGAGGLGKTRLLEEVYERCKPGGEWNAEGSLVATSLQDLMDIHLHTVQGFLHGVREGLRPAGLPEVQFPRYDAALSEYRQKALDNVDYARLVAAESEVYLNFWRDYEAIARTHRVVWLVDTAEQLAQSGTQWFLSEELLKEEWLQETHTGVWLRKILREAPQQLKNTTLIFAGRGEEGEAFFADIEKACREGGVKVVSVEVEAFTEEEVREYIAALKEEASEDVKPVYQRLLQDKSLLQRLHRYTGGQPVLLALFSDLLLEGNPVPRALWPDAPLPESEEVLARVRWELEEEILAQLFRPAGEAGTLRQEILLALVRAPEGLSAEQLHYVLDNPRDLSPEAWFQTPEGRDARRLAEIEAEMERLLQLAIVKRRPGRREIRPQGESDLLALGGQAQASLRIGLQDEVFRIFANHMAPHVQIGQPADAVEEQEREQLARMMNLLGEGKAQYERRYQNEVKARQRLYRLLRDWAAFQMKQYGEELYRIRLQEEQALSHELERATPAFPRLAHLKISERDRRRRRLYREVLRELELEHMTYAFLLDPDRELNESYVDLADRRWYANDEAGDLMVSESIWRLLHDRYAMRFVAWGEVREVVRQRDEHTLDTLRRALRQEQASRWIKRLALQRRPQEAKGFNRELEAWIAQLDKNKEWTWCSWTHTFARGERKIWVLFAQMFPAQGKELEKILAQFKEQIKTLCQLARASTDKKVIQRKNRQGEVYWEYGFRGHPAYLRLRRVVSMASAFAGYIATQLGKMSEAEKYYNLALAYLRETGMVAHRALVINNLSRLLAERGQPDALELCKDALNLRLQLGADQPIGLSHSTMALIYSRLNRPELAWQEAAKARLYFSRVEDPRGMGLASIQLGEALRLLAAQALEGYTSLSVGVSDIYEAARDALDEAIGIFGPEGEVDEPLRYLEALIEKGCLYREWLRVAPRELLVSHYGTSLSALRDAWNQARKGGWFRLELDAAVNLAWTHYTMGQTLCRFGEEYCLEEYYQQAEKEIEAVLRRIEEEYGKALSFIQEGEARPFLWYQASKLYGLQARLAIERCQRWVEQRRKQELGERDDRPSKDEFYRKIKAELRENPHGRLAARAWVQSLRYAYRFERCSLLTSIVFAGLYSYLKWFNVYELEAFTDWVEQVPLEADDERGKQAQRHIRHFLRTRLGMIEGEET